jgi:hypothetical protein
MDAFELNQFHANKASGAIVSRWVPQLSTGTQPPGQGSSVAPSLPETMQVSDNEVPFVPGGYRHHLAPMGTVGTQDQTSKPENQVANWVSVGSEACARMKKHPGQAIGLTPQGMGSLNMPGKVAPGGYPGAIRFSAL